MDQYDLQIEQVERKILRLQAQLEYLKKLKKLRVEEEEKER